MFNSSLNPSIGKPVLPSQIAPNQIAPQASAAHNRTNAPAPGRQVHAHAVRSNFFAANPIPIAPRPLSDPSQGFPVLTSHLPHMNAGTTAHASPATSGTGSSPAMQMHHVGTARAPMSACTSSKSITSALPGYHQPANWRALPTAHDTVIGTYAFRQHAFNDRARKMLSLGTGYNRLFGKFREALAVCLESPTVNDVTSDATEKLRSRSASAVLYAILRLHEHSMKRPAPMDNYFVQINANDIEQASTTADIATIHTRAEISRENINAHYNKVDRNILQIRPGVRFVVYCKFVLSPPFKQRNVSLSSSNRHDWLIRDFEIRRNEPLRFLNTLPPHTSTGAPNPPSLASTRAESSMSSTTAGIPPLGSAHPTLVRVSIASLRHRSLEESDSSDTLSEHDDTTDDETEDELSPRGSGVHEGLELHDAPPQRERTQSNPSSLPQHTDILARAPTSPIQETATPRGFSDPAAFPSAPMLEATPTRSSDATTTSRSSAPGQNEVEPPLPPRRTPPKSNPEAPAHRFDPRVSPARYSDPAVSSWAQAHYAFQGHAYSAYMSAQATWYGFAPVAGHFPPPYALAGPLQPAPFPWAHSGPTQEPTLSSPQADASASREYSNPLSREQSDQGMRSDVSQRGNESSSQVAQRTMALHTASHTDLHTELRPDAQSRKRLRSADTHAASRKTRVDDAASPQVAQTTATARTNNDYRNQPQSASNGTSGRNDN